MANLISISKVSGSSKGVLINNIRFLKEMAVKIENNTVSVVPKDGTEAFSGQLGVVEIDGSPIFDPDEAIAALEEIIPFNSGGGAPSSTPVVPTLQQVTDKGNATDKKITHAPGETNAESATLGQVEDRTRAITKLEIINMFN